MYMFARGLTFAFFRTLTAKVGEDNGNGNHKLLKMFLMLPQIIMNRSIHILRNDMRAHDHTLRFVIIGKRKEQNWRKNNYYKVLFHVHLFAEIICWRGKGNIKWKKLSTFKNIRLKGSLYIQFVPGVLFSCLHVILILCLTFPSD